MQVQRAPGSCGPLQYLCAGQLPFSSLDSSRGPSNVLLLHWEGVTLSPSRVELTFPRSPRFKSGGSFSCLVQESGKKRVLLSLVRKTAYGQQAEKTEKLASRSGHRYEDESQDHEFKTSRSWDSFFFLVTAMRT